MKHDRHYDRLATTALLAAFRRRAHLDLAATFRGSSRQGCRIVSPERAVVRRCEARLDAWPRRYEREPLLVVARAVANREPVEVQHVKDDQRQRYASSAHDARPYPPPRPRDRGAVDEQQITRRRRDDGRRDRLDEFAACLESTSRSCRSQCHGGRHPRCSNGRHQASERADQDAEAMPPDHASAGITTAQLFELA